jgi:hypothetical protein
MATIYINSVVINNIHNIVICGNAANNIVGMQINDYISEKQARPTVNDFDDQKRSKDIVLESIDYTRAERVLSLQKRLEASEKELNEIRGINEDSLNYK